MQSRFLLYLLLILLLTAVPDSRAFEYAYFSDHERTPAGDYLHWFVFDSVLGNVRSNDCISCVSVPPYIDGQIITHCPQPLCDFPYAELDAPIYVMPDYVSAIRSFAATQGQFYGRGPHWQYKLSLRGSMFRLYEWERGAPFDSLAASTIMYDIQSSGSNTSIFVDGPLRVSGFVNDEDLLIGCADDISIDDNIVLAGTDLETGDLPENAHGRIALVAEGSIIIRNTWENGRANSEQGSDVVITAVLISESEEGGLCLGQPNDPWDTYICPCSPDRRGAFILNGALLQRTRGRWFANNRGGTGYRTVLKYDPRLANWSIVGYGDLAAHIEPDSMFFGDVPLGESRQQILSISSATRFIYSGALCTYPFTASTGYAFTDTMAVPVTFTPPFANPYAGFVSFFIDGTYHAVPLRGRGVNPPGPAVVMSVAPNPFNPLTTITFSLTADQKVSLKVFNVAGQLVESLVDRPLPAGQHRFPFNGSDLASGVYFLKLNAGGIRDVQKIMLLR